jgi:hypothetical protein
MAVQNPPVKGGFEPPVMFFSAVVSNCYSIYKYEHKHVEGIDNSKRILLTDALLETPLLYKTQSRIL